MAIGLSPQYSETIPFSPLTPQQFLVLAIESAKKLEWELSYIGNNGFTAYTEFSMQSWSEEIKVKIEEGSATITSRCTGNQLIDYGKNRKNTEAFIKTLNEVKLELTPAAADEKYRELSATFSDNGALAEPETPMEKIKSFFSIFTPVRGYAATPVIILLNVAIYLVMILSGVHFMAPDGQSMIDWGANFGPETLDGQWWRLLTSCFLHFGIIHLLLNMYALLYIGVLLEPLLGTTRFTAAYLLTGIAASATSLWWHEGGAISAGASGAVFGMYGVFLAMLTTNFIDAAQRKALLTSIGVFVAYNLMNGLKGGQIDNSAHIGGLVAGLVAGYIFYPAVKKPEDKTLNYLTMTALAAIVFAGSAFVLTSSDNNMAKYFTALDRFTEYEHEALKVVNERQSLKPGTDLVSEMGKSLENWKKAELTLREADALDIDTKSHTHIAQLIQYCELRQQSFGLMKKGLEEGDENKYSDEITKIEDHVSSIISYMEKEQSQEK